MATFCFVRLSEDAAFEQTVLLCLRNGRQRSSWLPKKDADKRLLPCVANFFNRTVASSNTLIALAFAAYTKTTSAMLGYPAISALCLLVFLELGNAGDCEIRKRKPGADYFDASVCTFAGCFRDLKVNITLIESRGRDAAGEGRELDCNKENTAVDCERCCQLWAPKNGKSNVLSRKQTAEQTEVCRRRLPPTILLVRP